MGALLTKFVNVSVNGFAGSASLAAPVFNLINVPINNGGGESMPNDNTDNSSGAQQQRVATDDTYEPSQAQVQLMQSKDVSNAQSEGFHFGAEMSRAEVH